MSADRTSGCELERLLLLIYPDELGSDELHELRVHLTLCERCADVHAELEAVAAQLDLLPDPQMSRDERRELLVQVISATEPDDPDLRAALDLVGVDLEEDLRATLREGVLARVGLSAEDEDFSDLEGALDLVVAPALNEDARAALREGVLARVDILARVNLASDFANEDFSDLEGALDLVAAPALSEDARSTLREGVLARVGLAVSDAVQDATRTAVEPALDLLSAPALSESARVELQGEVLAKTGAGSGAGSGAPRGGLLLRFPGWAMAAAAALLLAGSAALFTAAPWIDSPRNTTQLAFEEAEILVRGSDELQVAHLAAARDRLQRVVLAGSSESGGSESGGLDPASLKRARRELVALDALRLRGEPSTHSQDIDAVPTREDPESFLRTKREVLELYPESLAALFVLTRYFEMAALRDEPVARRAVATPAQVSQALSTSLGASLETLRERDAQALLLKASDAELKKRFSSSLVRSIRQALLIQRGLHAERSGDRAAALAWYQQVDSQTQTRAAEIARDLLQAAAK
ncbi:MAG: hypothetical protein JKY65_18765 [Planctomycetes bacterium]|nr:hypothetical protein [Planctomycetota bacterium]